MKKCTKCKLEKNECDFYKNNRNKDGLKSWCKLCSKEDNKKREHKYNDYRKKYREENKEEYKRKKKKYYVNNKIKILESNKKWRRTLNGKFASYKESARKRSLKFSLTLIHFENFWNKNCKYCDNIIEGIGLDRIDNTKGYEIDNVVPCCSTCNKMKMTLTKDEFLKHISKIYNNNEF